MAEKMKVFPHVKKIIKTFSESTTPLEKNLRKPSGRRFNVGWDISHAGRFVHVFNTLYKNREVTGTGFPDRKFMEELTNQFLYGVFNGDFKKPLFTNFMDGTNGWYRVGYNGRLGYGYSPWSMSFAALTGGYAFWMEYNNDIERLYYALLKMIISENPEIRRHVMEYYEKTHFYHYKKVRAFDFSNMENPNTKKIYDKILAVSLLFRQVATKDDYQ